MIQILLLKIKAKNILHKRCKSCTSLLDRNRYLNLSANDKQFRKNKARAYVTEVRVKVFNFLKNHSCVDCGEKNPIVLDFDHIDPKSKTGSISELSKTWSWESLKGEIAKCEIRCANCHRIRTAEQFGYYKFLSL